MAGVAKRFGSIGAVPGQGPVRRIPGGLSSWVSKGKFSAARRRDGDAQTAAGVKGYVRSKWEEGPWEAGAGISQTGASEMPDNSPRIPSRSPSLRGSVRAEGVESQPTEAARPSSAQTRESKASPNGKQKTVNGANSRSHVNSAVTKASISGGSAREPTRAPNGNPIGFELVTVGGKHAGGAPRLDASERKLRNSAHSLQNESSEEGGADAPSSIEASSTATPFAVSNPAPNPVVNQVLNGAPVAVPNLTRNQIPTPAPNPVRRKWEELLPEPPKLLEPEVKPQISLAAVTEALTSAAAEQEESRRKWEQEVALPPKEPPPPPPQKIQKSRLAAILSSERGALERDVPSQGGGIERGSPWGGGDPWADGPPVRQGLHFFKDGFEHAEVDPEIRERQIAQWLSNSGVAGRKRGEESSPWGESSGLGRGLGSGLGSGSEGNLERRSLSQGRVNGDGFGAAGRRLEKGPFSGTRGSGSGLSPRLGSGSQSDPGAGHEGERPQARRQLGRAERGSSFGIEREAASRLRQERGNERPRERLRSGPSESGFSPEFGGNLESEVSDGYRGTGLDRRRQFEPSESGLSHGSRSGSASGFLDGYRDERIPSPRQPRGVESGFRRRVDENDEGQFEGYGSRKGESRPSGPGSGQWESDSWQGLAKEVEEESPFGPSEDAFKRRTRNRSRFPTVEVDRDSWLLGGPRPNSTKREDDALTEPGYPANPDLEEGVVEEASDLIGGREFVRVRLPRQDDNPVDVADLHQAIMQRDFSRLWWLVEQKGADVNQLDDRILGYYTTALHVACEIGDPTMVIRLIENGARADIADEFGRFPIVSALIGKEGYVTKMAVIEALLQTGVGVQQRNPLNGKLPIHYSVIGPSDVIVYLKSKGANLDAKDLEGRTPLHDALEVQDPNDPAFRNVEYLLGLGARPNSVDKQGKTPLHIAAERHEYVRCKELLRWKANVNARDRSGRTPMRYVRPQPYGEDSIISLFQRFRGHL
ncbi:hypothetical protein KFL_002360100 [Klebsormidium nitens]|uniref:Uncharacterized protein n=1 Tax=Klebsormidium nitens TaxID=105231 RepID=A0A0U9HK33_KLENI|nr:hypothetical protein KFL_002360100 [Klebsormidium nitens]|eukprot:GAQ85458.1 hypothetical protein KFL_002360100 [Klebsormidium nitens]